MSHTFEESDRLDFSDYLRIAHGVFMTVSWGIFIVTGVLFARHFRGYETEYCGLKMWFSMHRALNTIGLVGVFLGSVCIIASERKWTGPQIPLTGTRIGGWHSLIGSLAIILAFAQPINAFFRCKEGSRKRKRFVWTHRILGFASVIFALIAMLIATSFFGWMFFHSTTAMIMWIFYLVALGLSMTIKGCISYREWKVNRLTPTGKIVFESDCAKKWKNITLMLFLISAIVLCFGLCALMVLRPFQ